MIAYTTSQFVSCFFEIFHNEGQTSGSKVG